MDTFRWCGGLLYGLMWTLTRGKVQVSFLCPAYLYVHLWPANVWHCATQTYCKKCVRSGFVIDRLHTLSTGPFLHFSYFLEDSTPSLDWLRRDMFRCAVSSHPWLICPWLPRKVLVHLRAPSRKDGVQGQYLPLVNVHINPYNNPPHHRKVSISHTIVVWVIGLLLFWLKKIKIFKLL